MKKIALLLTIFIVSCVQETSSELSFNDNSDTTPGTSESPISQNITGQKLYEQNCMSCHGDLNYTVKSNRSMSEVKQAINSVPEMSFLSKLSDEQIDEITEALSLKAPEIRLLKPSGELEATVTQVTLSFYTNEDSQCRYSQDDQNYNNMASSFISADKRFHEKVLSVVDGEEYFYFVRCVDSYGNQNGSSSLINFTVKDKDAPDLEKPIITSFSPEQDRKFLTDTQTIDLVITTNELTTCRMSTSSTISYSSMEIIALGESQRHEKQIGSLVNGGNYLYFIQCRDLAGNFSEKMSLGFSVSDSELTGKQLYDDNCMQCHGDLENSNKKLRTATQITDAINNLGVMDRPHLKALKANHINLIADALAVEEEVIIDEGALNTSLVLADRRYLDFVMLHKVFGIPMREDRPSRRDDYFLFGNQDHGGPCDSYAQVIKERYGDAEFIEERCNSIRGKIADRGISYSTQRASFIIRACETSAANREMRAAALADIGGESSPWSTESFIKLYQKFYLLETPEQIVIDKFKEVYDAQTNNGKKWQSVLVGICISPEWQVL